MIIVIKLHYFVNGMKNLQQGEFRVHVRKYKEDPDKEAARIAYEWFRKVKRDFIYDVTLYKVLYNEKDITELVKEKESWPLNQVDE
ncbi:hypothetical protein H4O14_02425 [Bacillus sp. PAMC26568]|nr:hypothetical protein H4O14_02425 [Bacillus sp. PAMC26568]